ncbi:MAG: hypothetical protein UW35_C0028G0025 [Candidatus Collierbacteria bacterium GW2011_GWF2_44_15]|uniref:Uncharacterized protein n=2 Tax=Candidatus Collieribacteriota TaxID=1752725 RepID=A0A0G1HEY3_9BACT|nr:MAG: hypothetical protein UW35_C0028G0025 [Candidatus Collierbacteria bacterium GW2011_GWF2_44_15]KKU27461.1 MAG: hypothetical protein UX41_C0051G0009 [Candidatus Collierbacteria bacterium GW2011_GWE1_46_18]
MYSIPILLVLFFLFLPLFITALMNRKVAISPWYDITMAVIALTLFMLNLLQFNSGSGTGFDQIAAYAWLFNAVVHMISLPIDINRHKNGW